MDNKVTQLRDRCININLRNFLETGSEQSLETLHMLIKGEFMKVLNWPFYLLPKKIRNQRISKLASTEEDLNKRLNKDNNYNEYKFHIINYIFFDIYKKSFLDEVCSIDYYDGRIKKYSFINPLWEVLNSININKMNDTVKKCNLLFKDYLILKFSDYYWNYLIGKLRHDYINYLNLSISMNELECKTSENGDTYYLDIFQSKNNLFIELKSYIADEETFNKFLNNHFSKKEITVINLLIKGYTSKDVSKILHVSDSTVRNQKASIKKKLKSLEQ
ncbi:helix-turn-helix domain-containing protein [Candidatus Clostridium radicumherbarum]|uniref:Helix-turn-helix transcriptional regulator n=1 Tax=Candidatus Clostridium radicumherbarum TaxID=3381662 RepID=A0ABW8TZ47_9CLOT